MIERLVHHPAALGGGEPDVKLLVLDDYDALSREAARIFSEEARRGVNDKGYFTVALSGGQTPRGFFEILASSNGGNGGEVPWEDVYLFWGDERCVNLTHPECNYSLFHDVMVGEVDIPPENVHPMPGELKEGGAFMYEEELKEFFDEREKGFVRLPSLDLVYLGLGGDGHTLSLFPGSAALGAQRRLVMHVMEEGLEIPERLTMTASFVNNSKRVVFLVSGGGKATILKKALFGSYNPRTCPAQSIRPASGGIVFLVDKEAASELDI